MRISRLTTVGAALAAAALLVPSTASAHGGRTPKPVVRSDQLAAPFNLAVSGHSVYVADGGLNLVGRLTRGGGISPIATDQPGASGIARSTDGRRLAFTTTVTNEDTFENTASGLHMWGPRGSRVFADTLAYEQANNPDAVNHYGGRQPEPVRHRRVHGRGSSPTTTPARSTRTPTRWPAGADPGWSPTPAPTPC